MAQEEKRIGTALISVYSKEGLLPLVQQLAAYDVTILSTGGTWEYLKSNGIDARKVEDLTGYPSILGGRVKTLHPLIFGGILARRGAAESTRDVKEYNIPMIDLVVVDLYPFSETLAKGGSEEELVEKIDIGGGSLLRAAAKNYEDVLVVSSRQQYDRLLELLKTGKGTTTRTQRRAWAAEAFKLTCSYDASIAAYFDESEGLAKASRRLSAALLNGQTATRYGENPHQKGAFIGDLAAMFTKLHGKELSYNNLLDLDSGVGLIDEFPIPTMTIVKHGTPCGLATAETLPKAWEKALAGDPQSAFGGVILSNAPIDSETAARMDSIFFEVCLAPDYAPDALDILERRKNRILLKRGSAELDHVTIRSALNGFLIQDRDEKVDVDIEELCVTDAKADKHQLLDLQYANRAVKHCKSNAIIIFKRGQLIGVGAGETSRVNAVKHAIEKAKAYGHSLEGAVLASDAYFPFSDSVEEAARAGITAIIQPGGSIRDEESIGAANRLGVAMYTTGYRHFKH